MFFQFIAPPNFSPTVFLRDRVTAAVVGNPAGYSASAVAIGSTTYRANIGSLTGDWVVDIVNPFGGGYARGSASDTVVDLTDSPTSASGPVVPVGNGYYANAAAAIQNHMLYFGNTANNLSIQFRAGKTDTWIALQNAIVHREDVKPMKTSTGWSRVAMRSLFVAAVQTPSSRLLSEIKIDGIIYTVAEIKAAAAGRCELKLHRAAAMEVTRPGYRRN